MGLIKNMEILSIPNMRVEEPPLLAHSIAANLETAIIYGDISGGTRLTEEIVCKMTGSSRSPVREALRLLEKDGLAIREPRRGVRVSELTVTELDQLYVCRITLETAASELAVKNGTDADMCAIRDAHELCRQMLEKDDVRGHFKANVEMSHRIFEAAHNEPLLRLLGTIHKQALRYRFFAYENSRLIREKSVENNTHFVDLLIGRDGQGSAQCARRGIESSHKVIRECLIAEAGSQRK